MENFKIIKINQTQIRFKIGKKIGKTEISTLNTFTDIINNILTSSSMDSYKRIIIRGKNIRVVGNESRLKLDSDQIDQSLLNNFIEELKGLS